MKQKLYIETSIVSYLTSLPSRDIITAARQQLTRKWWQAKRGDFELYISEFVLAEASLGDQQAAALRLEALNEIQEIEVTETARRLARIFLERGALPEKAAVDAFHIAVAVSGGMEFLLTWNFKHLANAMLRNKVERLCRQHGYEPCIVCTPEELLEE
jgi:predicted nucleic acid-binding protein